MPDRPQFLFITCQVGAESAVKLELARQWPAFRLAYSRPGFLTFKLPADHGLAEDFELRSVFARSYGFSIGKLVESDDATLARRVWELWGQRPLQRIHVWDRDATAAGQHGFEPGISPTAMATAQAIAEACPWPGFLPNHAVDYQRPSHRDDTVLDCVLVKPGEWWVGSHRVHSVASQWPGGMMSIAMPPDVVSRAYLKMEEALRWSRLPIPAGARCVELGSSPGGASQALLAHGFEVIGVDPAEMHATVLAHPRFTHIRRRASQVRRREFRKVRWLTADMNVAPAYTLEAVEAIVTHPQINIRGMLLTLKLFEWNLVEELPSYLDRVRSWGFNLVRARQLQHNHQEVCVAAIQKPFVRKPSIPRAR
jgi:23S rRNA (cytidine2498-2'-O)-methyltransferase